MTAFDHDCRDIASRLMRQAAVIAVFVILVLAAAIAAMAMTAAARPLPATLLMIISLAATIASFGLSALLRFDAALFTLMASCPDEMSAGRAVDEFLAKAKLKPLPAATRPLADRIAGARRLMMRQRIVALIFAIVTVLALAANFA